MFASRPTPTLLRSPSEIPQLLLRLQPWDPPGGGGGGTTIGFPPGTTITLGVCVPELLPPVGTPPAGPSRGVGDVCPGAVPAGCGVAGLTGTTGTGIRGRMVGT